MEQLQFYRFLWRIFVLGIALKMVVPLMMGIFGVIIDAMVFNALSKALTPVLNEYGTTCFYALFFDIPLTQWVWACGEQSHSSPEFFGLLCLMASILFTSFQGFLVFGVMESMNRQRMQALYLRYRQAITTP